MLSDSPLSYRDTDQIRRSAPAYLRRSSPFGRTLRSAATSVVPTFRLRSSILFYAAEMENPPVHIIAHTRELVNH